MSVPQIWMELFKRGFTKVSSISDLKLSCWWRICDLKLQCDTPSGWSRMEQLFIPLNCSQTVNFPPASFGDGLQNVKPLWKWQGQTKTHLVRRRGGKITKANTVAQLHRCYYSTSYAARRVCSTFTLTKCQIQATQQKLIKVLGDDVWERLLSHSK